ncbi:MAG: galactosyl transferase [Burkholderiales bacterium]
MLTFVIPVRHPANAKNWPQLKRLLEQTAVAISQQDNHAWRAVVVANTGADLPALPERFEVKRVDFAPNPKHELGQNEAEREAVYDAFRYDKGRRVLAGMLHMRDSDYFMIVDDDDFVSRKLAGFVADRHGASGWYIKNGYVWTDGGHGLYLHPSFHTYCGTSHIVRSDLMELPQSLEQAATPYIKQMLGSHLFLKGYLHENGNPLSPLPFVGAVYRIGHPGAHSKSASLWRTFVFQRSLTQRPWVILRNVLRMRVVTARLRRDFFGG